MEYMDRSDTKQMLYGPTLLYIWYPLFQAQWDRCDQQNYSQT